jgi:acetaldehyde dehydrogenase/alcohol dehydrogenase
MLWFRVPDKIYFKYGCLPVALEELNAMKKKRAFIVTDKVLFDLGYTHKITDILSRNNIEYKIFSDVEPDPTLEKFYASMDEMVEQAFDDQCTGANPRYPLMSEIKEMYIKSYEGNL